MPSVLCRRNSMNLLSLYDLETLPHLFTSNENSQDPSLPIARLEDLSNELLIDIFEYFSPYDLHHGLYNLNWRFNSICEIRKLSIDTNGSKCAFGYYCSHQQPFASQIYSMILDDQYDRLKIFNQWNPMEHFSNLRMLTIEYTSQENLEKILSQLSTCSHLFYLNIYSTLIQSAELTKMIFGIRTLKKLILQSFDPIILHFNSNDLHPLTELEYLEIDACSFATFLNVLEHIDSNIQHLRIRLIYESHHNGTVINSTIINEWLSNHQVPSSLHRLEIKFSFLPLTNFYLLLRLFPSLTDLMFMTFTNEMDYISTSLWHEFLSTNLSHLTQLRFHMEIKGLLTDIVPCPTIDQIDLFQSMNSQWLASPIVMDYNSLLPKPVLEFYTNSQLKKFGKYSLDLYGRTRYISPSMTNVTTNINRNLTQLRVTLNDDQHSIYDIDGCYPKVTKLAIHSQITRSLIEDDRNNKLILSDIIKSIPDLSKITSLKFTSDSSFYPSAILVRRLLAQMPKVKRLQIGCNQLLSLLKSPLICVILKKKISALTIEFHAQSPVLPDLIQILEVFSSNLRHLEFWINGNFSSKSFSFILPIIFGELGEKFYSFRMLLWHTVQYQPLTFDDQFKQRLTHCLNAQLRRKRTKPRAIEYRIRENKLSVRFE